MIELDLARAQELLGDDEASDGVARPAAGVADDVGVTFLEAERSMRVDARVHLQAGTSRSSELATPVTKKETAHASHDRKLAGGRQGQRALVAPGLGVLSIGVLDLVNVGHLEVVSSLVGSLKRESRLDDE